MNDGDLSLLLSGLDAHPDGMMLFDADRRVTYMNATAEGMSGLPSELCRGRRITELADVSDHFSRHAGFYAILHEVIGEVMATGIAHSDDDGSRLDLDGGVVSVSLRLTPVMRDGRAVGAMFVIRDHTAEGSLMFRQAAVAMAHVDREANVREANDALLQLIGRQQHEVLGRPFTSLLDPDDVDAATPALEGVLRRRTSEGRLEVRVRNADGSLRWVDLSISGNGMGGPGSGGACAILQDVTQRVRLQAELEQARVRLQALAMHDPLTGLPNRTQLDDELVAAQRRAAVSGLHVAVLFIDLDGFKPVNDTAGHETGDRLLVEVGGRLRHLLRPDDVAARFGGDEFVLCCGELAADPELAREQAESIADRVRSSMAVPFEVDGAPWELGASVGIALSRAGDHEPAAMLRAADADMYRAKATR